MGRHYQNKSILWGTDDDSPTLTLFSRSASIRGRPLCNLRFADDIDLPGGSEEELQQLTEELKKTASGYGMEIRSAKSNILVNRIKPRASTNIWMHGKIAGRRRPIHISRVRANQKRNINKGSKDQTGVSTLSQASNTMGK